MSKGKAEADEDDLRRFALRDSAAAAERLEVKV